jgi:lipopolysaccharide export LptBFGC system permease protein LptF
VLFGLLDRTATPVLLLALPIALWEFSLGVWLVVKGFNASASVLAAPNTARHELVSAD